MNKIIVSNKGIHIDDKLVKDNVINIDDDSEYILKYVDNGTYDITFVVNGNVRIIESSFDKDVVINNQYIVNGSLHITKFYNNYNVKESIDIELCKENALIEYTFANICRGVEDYIININHKCKGTVSNIINKSVALKNSHINFIINSSVSNEAVKSELNQSTRIVTMGDSDASISPNMFIDLDDVNARHGSVIGTFKDEDIFYIMSKGISYNDTLKLLIKGYLLANLKIDIDLRMEILKTIDMYWR